MKTHLYLLAVGVVLVSGNAASAQFPRSRGTANPRYFPDLYKGPAWGMTLSEYYTFGNKADGSFGYAQHGYREGSNDEILRWKQATGTDIPPGYYLQRLRARRGERPTPGPAGLGATVRPPILIPRDRGALSASDAGAPEEAYEPDLAEQEERAASESTQKSSRRNAQLRGVATEKSPQTEKFSSAVEPAPFKAGALNFPRNDSMNRATRDDKY